MLRRRKCCAGVTENAPNVRSDATVQLCIPLLRELLLENVQNSNGQSQLFDANIKSESGPKYFTDVLDFCVHLTFVFTPGFKETID